MRPRAPSYAEAWWSARTARGAGEAFTIASSNGKPSGVFYRGGVAGAAVCRGLFTNSALSTRPSPKTTSTSTSIEQSTYAAPRIEPLR